MRWGLVWKNIYRKKIPVFMLTSFLLVIFLATGCSLGSLELIRPVLGEEQVIKGEVFLEVRKGCFYG
ncbi:MAG: hypothetical protein C4554_06315 [Dethiobacter sp.]|nr:MAG: hypothetical protein C4554_06315 [Dethiobacter sp.]